MIYDFSVSFYVELLAGLSRQNRQLACKLTLFARIVRKKASNNVVFWREIFEFWPRLHVRILQHGRHYLSEVSFKFPLERSSPESKAMKWDVADFRRCVRKVSM